MSDDKGQEAGLGERAERKANLLRQDEIDANYHHRSCWKLTDTIADLREALAEIHQWAGAYDWYFCDGDVEGELIPLRDRIGNLVATDA